MNWLQDNTSSDPIESELHSWRAVDVPKDTNEQLIVAMRSGWQAASSERFAEELGEVAGERRGSETQDVHPTATTVGKRSWLIACGTLLATAASIAVAVSIAAAERTVYAQAIAAIKNAHSLHAVVRRFDRQGSTTGPIAEIWYDARHGSREQLVRDGVVSSAIIDDGQHTWGYLRVSNTVIKSQSRGRYYSFKQAIESLEMVEKHGAIVDVSIAPPRDLHGCQAHVLQQKSEDVPLRFVFWVDEKMRLRRFEKSRMRSGNWARFEQMDIKYDVEISEKRFQVDFKDARLIEHAISEEQES